MEVEEVKLCFPLTPRQWVIAKHIGQGQMAKECAYELRLSVLYVEQVVARIGMKLSGTGHPTERIRAWWSALS